MNEQETITCGDGLICPHCGHLDRDAWDHDGDSGTTECPKCDKPYFWEREISINYISAKLKP